jgi:hopanoid biosynthesis associated RND transporter like protein HpnN
MSSSQESIIARGLRILAGWVCRYPRLCFYPQLVLMVLAVFYTVEHLQFSTSRNDLVGADKKYHHNFLEFRKEFGAQDDLVAVVESEDLEKNRQFVERLGARLDAETNLFSDVFYKGDLKVLGRKALMFLDEPTLRELHATLVDFRPFLQRFGTASNLHSLFKLVNSQFAAARPEQNAENEAMVKALPALTRIVSQASDAMDRPGTPPSPGLTVLFGGGPEAEQSQYITFASNRIYLVTARALREDLNGDAVERLRVLVGLTQAEVPGLNVAITGEPVLEMDEMNQSQVDTMIATVVSFVLVALIFIYGYSESGRPVKATLCLLPGLAYTMGFTTLVVGHLNILTITFAPILIGLAIDFGVHLITRYEEELRRGRAAHEAMELAMVNTGLGIFTGCVTTSAAFLAMGATNFRGIQEMGIISGGGLLVCLVPMITMLPVLLLRGRQNLLDHAAAPAVDSRARVERIWLDRPWTVLGLTVVSIVVCLVQLPRVRFDYNLLNMQSKGLPAVVFEQKLIDSANKSVLFGAVVADSLEEAVRMEGILTNLPTVGSVESMTRFLGEDQSSKLEEIRAVKSEVNRIHFAEMDLDPVSVKALGETLTFTQGYLEWAGNTVKKEGDEALYQQLRSLRTTLHDLVRKMHRDEPRASEKLAKFQQALFRDVQETFTALRHQEDSGPVRVADLPATFRSRFVGQSGKFLLQVYPKADVWQRENQEQFVQELRRALDPDQTNHPIITGTPVQLLEYTSLLVNSYLEAAGYALATIAVLVLIHFRSLAAVVLALLPVAIGTLWTVGLMVWLGLPFNPANIMTLPLVVGVGVTNGIHILNRYSEEQSPSILARSTGKAVVVSALTTVAGFGSLMLAEHQGIKSLGLLMAVGTTACMASALTCLPALLFVLGRWGWGLPAVIKKTQ